jgi:protein-arginine kinase activator protein McsA
MLCEICHRKEATVYWNSFKLSTETDEHLQLCQTCANERMPPEALQKIQEAKKSGRKTVSGWTGYNPVSEN